MTDLLSRDYSSKGWTPERVAVFREEFGGFLNVCKVNSKEVGPMVLGENLYDAQNRFLDFVFDCLSKDIHDIKHLKSRQLGVSTISRALTLFWAGVHDGLRGYMVYDTQPHTEEARLELIEMLVNLPAEYAFPRIARQNRYMVRLENDTVINFASAGVKESKSTGTLGRSSGINFHHGSEICSWHGGESIESYKNALAKTFPNRLYVWESTGRGPNIWKDMCDEAEADPHHQAFLFSGWWCHNLQRIERDDPDYERYTSSPLSDGEHRRIRAVYERYGHTITPEQLAWIRRYMDPGREVDEGERSTDEIFRLREQAWCVTRDTRVGTTTGILRIEDVAVGQQNTLGTVMHAGATGRSPIWRVTTKLGYEVSGTANHPLITVGKEEIELSQSLGARIMLQSPLTAEWPYFARWTEGIIDCAVNITPPFARLAGLYMGDGSISGNPSWKLKITCCDDDADLIDEVKRLLHLCFGVEAWLSKQPSRCTDVGTAHRLIVETFYKLGLVRKNSSGGYRRRVCVPEFIWRSPKMVIKEFLSGLFEADGCVRERGGGIQLFSQYPGFVRDIQILLLAFGITSRRTRKEVHRNGKVFIGGELNLRVAEAQKFCEEIGFLSARKRARLEREVAQRRSDGYKNGWLIRDLPIELTDEVVEVTDLGVEDEVFNLTVEGSHLFDANGILTHNTSDEAWLLTSRGFFPAQELSDIKRSHSSNRFRAYTYSLGLEFHHTRISPTINPRLFELKVWDEPQEGACYIVSADVAHGANEHNDHSTAQVLRAYADGLDQVAEFSSPVVNTTQYAWVLASLAGWYAGSTSQVTVIIEIQGGGDATWREFQGLKRRIAQGYQAEEIRERGLQNLFHNVRNYMYTRSDSIGGASRNYQWKTNYTVKPSMMEQMRGYVMSQHLIIRSEAAYNQMQAVVREGDSISAATGRDDNVISLAIGCRCWDEQIRPRMVTQRRTREIERARTAMSISDMSAIYNKNVLEAMFAVKYQERIRERAVMAAEARRYGGRRRR